MACPFFQGDNDLFAPPAVGNRLGVAGTVTGRQYRGLKPGQGIGYLVTVVAIHYPGIDFRQIARVHLLRLSANGPVTSAVYQTLQHCRRVIAQKPNDRFALVHASPECLEIPHQTLQADEDKTKPSSRG
jgi:hypothetical protein